MPISAAASAAALLALALAMPSAPGRIDAPPSLRRLALLVGANHGTPDRPALRYAVRDAKRFGRVLTAMGGVAAGDVTVLEEPSAASFRAALGRLGRDAGAAREAASRVEVLVYFSGHADDLGLMLGSERLDYPDLRRAIRAMPVDVGIAVLDACASGAITRLKGGSAQAPFLSDVSMDVKGYAFLASSAEGEAAQESDRLGGSYFTQALLTGMRGAADVSGDGRVTLGEAYQFAFNETLSQTTTSQGGAQHPSYDIKMAGTGDVVMTDVRRISASLILGAEYDGRFYVLDDGEQLVAELHKPAGRVMELGLEPGEYRVYYERSRKLMSAPLALVEGQRQELAHEGLRPARRLPTLSRGGPSSANSLEGRTRLEFGMGLLSDSVDTFALGGSRVSENPYSVSLVHWLRPGLALEAEYVDRELVEAGVNGVFAGSIRGVLLGVRYYPGMPGPIRVFGHAGAGVFDDVGVRQAAADRGPSLGTRLGLGGDLWLGRHLTLSGEGALIAVSGRETHLDLRLGAGWAWGGARP